MCRRSPKALKTNGYLDAWFLDTGHWTLDSEVPLVCQKAKFEAFETGKCLGVQLSLPRQV